LVLLCAAEQYFYDSVILRFIMQLNYSWFEARAYNAVTRNCPTSQCYDELLTQHLTEFPGRRFFLWPSSPSRT